MNRPLALFAAAALFGSIGLVQAKTETIVTTTTNPDGTVTRQVEQREVPNSVPDQSFEWADRNHNGCIDRQEAKDMGILNFAKADTKRRGCLDRDEYEHALISQ